jgi:signal transduction histidine kinase
MLGSMLGRIPRWFKDGLLVLLVGAAAVAGVAKHGQPAAFLPLAFLATGALVLRRRLPAEVLALEMILAALGAALGHNAFIPAVLVALGGYAAAFDRTRSLRALIAVGVVIGIPVVARNWTQGGELIPIFALFLAAWLWGENHRARELEREERARSSAASERARIARELHDVVTHNVSVMVVQAAAGNDVFESHPDRARDALRAVEDTGRRALGELRRLLDVEAGEGTLPQPGLARLDELVGQVRRAGLAVELHVEGTAFVLPEGVDLSAYRIVQEALTNTLRHAQASHANVHVRYGTRQVEVEVTDDGVGESAPSESGRGLLGMRERVALFGGDLRVGGRPGGGFAVRATIPVGAA